MIDGSILMDCLWYTHTAGVARGGSLGESLTSPEQEQSAPIQINLNSMVKMRSVMIDQEQRQQQQWRQQRQQQEQQAQQQSQRANVDFMERLLCSQVSTLVGASIERAVKIGAHFLYFISKFPWIYTSKWSFYTTKYIKLIAILQGALFAAVLEFNFLGMAWAIRSGFFPLFL